MPRGGYRPGSGPKKGTKYKKRSIKPEDILAITMTQGKKNVENDDKPENVLGSLITQEQIKAAKKIKLTALEFLQSLYKTEGIDNDLRFKAAIQCLPYEQPKAGDEKGTKKKNREERAKEAVKGKFAPTTPPKLTTLKGGQ